MTLPLPITLSLYCYIGAVTPGNNNRDCVIGTGSVICLLYHPYLVSFSFYAIPICPLSQNSQDFSFTCTLTDCIQACNQSVGRLCRDDTSEISRDPRTKRLQTRLARPSENTKNNS